MSLDPRALDPAALECGPLPPLADVLAALAAAEAAVELAARRAGLPSTGAAMARKRTAARLAELPGDLPEAERARRRVGRYLRRLRELLAADAHRRARAGRDGESEAL